MLSLFGLVVVFVNLKMVHLCYRVRRSFYSYKIHVDATTFINDCVLLVLKTLVENHEFLENSMNEYNI